MAILFLNAYLIIYNILVINNHAFIILYSAYIVIYFVTKIFCIATDMSDNRT